jgi:hypothetical protein
MCPACAGSAESRRDNPLTSIAQVLQLTNSQAGAKIPFRLEAQVTLYQPERYRSFLQDGSLAIYFLPPDAPTVQSGDWVLVEGTTDSGLFAPILLTRRMIFLRHSALPSPVEFTGGATRLPEAGNVWAVARGSILRARRAVLSDFSTFNLDLKLKSGETVLIELGRREQCNLEALANSDVEIAGVVTDISYLSEDFSSSVQMKVSGCKDIRIVKPAVEQWSLAQKPIGSLLGYQSGTKIGSVVHVAGIVTQTIGSDQFFIQQDDSGVLVDLAVPSTLPAVGEKVQVVGRIARGELGTKHLVSARYRSCVCTVSIDKSAASLQISFADWG